MDEETRRNTLHNYVRSEPTIKVNFEEYLISVTYHDEGVTFYAIHKYLQNRGSTVKVLNASWKQCNCGLSLAYLYGQVLDTFERDLVQSGGRQLVA